MNVVVLQGRLSSDPRRRELASGTEMLSYEVTTRDESGAPSAPRAASVPVVWFDARRPPALAEGDEVVVVGHIRRRFFRAGPATVSRTEVVAGTVARAGTARAARATVAAVEGLKAA